MHSIYIDTTFNLIIGLLDVNKHWIEYLTFEDKKPSDKIHFEVYQLLEKYNLNINEIRFFFANGPGSYTGMRLSEGFAKVLELSNIETYSFYHFEILELLNLHDSFWATNAFKNEIFVFEFGNAINKVKLLSPNEFVEYKEKNKKGYTLDKGAKFFENFISSNDLIKDNSEILFNTIQKNKMRKAPYYFRILEEEFKTC